MKFTRILSAILITGTSQAAVVQIGELILVNNIGTATRYDPNTGTLNTQNSGGPVNIPSTFIGYSQLMGGETPSADDLGLRTFSTSTQILNLSKNSSTSLAGGVQWTFDLTPLDSYLAGNSLTATTLRLQLDIRPNNTSGIFNSYISYTNAREGITLTPLPATATGIYTDFHAPGNAATVGSVVNGDFKVIGKGLGGNNYDASTVVPLLDLYNSGVRQFSVTLVGASFSSSGQQVSVDGSSGLFLETIPEPSAAFLGGLGALVLLRRRR